MEDKRPRQSRLLVPFLLLVIIGLVAISFYQNNVIRAQSAEIGWMLKQGIMGGTPQPKHVTPSPAATPASPAATADPAGKSRDQKAARP